MLRFMAPSSSTQRHDDARVASGNPKFSFLQEEKEESSSSSSSSEAKAFYEWRKQNLLHRRFASDGSDDLQLKIFMMAQGSPSFPSRGIGMSSSLFTLCIVEKMTMSMSWGQPSIYYHINSLIIFTLCIMKKTTIVNVVMPFIITLIYLSFSIFVLRRTFTMTMLWSLMDNFSKLMKTFVL